MAQSKYTLYKYVRLEDGSWRYCRAALYANRRGKCQEAIERALKLHPGKFVSWRKLCTKYHLYRHGATVLGRVYKEMVAEGMMEEASKDSEAKDGRKTKRVKYVKLAD
jgi:hypothetical protein